MGVTKHLLNGMIVQVHGGFLKWWYPTAMSFPTKNDHFVVFWEYHHLRRHRHTLNNPFFFIAQIFSAFGRVTEKRRGIDWSPSNSWRQCSANKTKQGAFFGCEVFMLTPKGPPKNAEIGWLLLVHPRLTFFCFWLCFGKMSALQNVKWSCWFYVGVWQMIYIQPFLERKTSQQS